MKRRIFLAAVIVALAVGSLLGYSYGRLLALERRHMPNLATMSPPSIRKVHFNLWDPWVCWLPHWTVSYNERITDLRYITPSITVDIFGRLSDASSKEVRMSLGIY